MLVDSLSSSDAKGTSSPVIRFAISLKALPAFEF